MKKQITGGTGSKQVKSKGLRPENKDELDSRKNEEQDFKGDDVTHNKKEIESRSHLKGRRAGE
jgi:hypothetical protein